MSNKLVELHNIYAGYDGETILHNINLDISDDDFIGIIGPNGGGKSTLLKVILGLIKPYSGDITLHTSKENLFGYLPQNSNYDKMFPISVREVVLSGLMSKKGLIGKYSKEDKATADNILEKYGLKEYIRKPIGEISGGQAQRAFLCRAIISSPKILILDEPTTYVDSNFENEFYSILKNLSKTMAVVMVSHDLGTICSYVKTIACVNRGLHYHRSNVISEEQLKSYNCPIEILAHGPIPHRVLELHND